MKKKDKYLMFFSLCLASESISHMRYGEKNTNLHQLTKPWRNIPTFYLVIFRFPNIQCYMSIQPAAGCPNISHVQTG